MRDILNPVLVAKPRNIIVPGILLVSPRDVEARVEDIQGLLNAGGRLLEHLLWKS